MNTLFRLSVLLAFVLLSFGAVAQMEVATAAQIEAFYATKTYVVLHPDEMGKVNYNDAVTKAVAERWTLTKTEVISYGEFKELQKNKDCSFLMLNEMAYTDKGVSVGYNFMQLLLGGFAQTSRMPMLCSVPLSYSGAEDEDFAYKVPALVLFMQNHVALTKSDPSINEKNILQYYEKNLETIGNKTLYVAAADLAPEATPSAIKAVCSKNIEITDAETIEKVVADRQKDAIFLHKIGPLKNSKKSRCWKIMVGADDGKLYYTDYHLIDKKNPDGILLRDFKKIGKK